MTYDGLPTIVKLAIKLHVPYQTHYHRSSVVRVNPHRRNDANCL